LLSSRHLTLLLLLLPLLLLLLFLLLLLLLHTGYQEAAWTSAFVAIEAAVANTGSTNSQTLTAALNSMYEPSYFGLLNANEKGINIQKGMFLLQRGSSNELGIVTPTESANMDFIYPMPSWAERDYVPPAAETYSAPVWLIVVNSIFAISNIAFCVFMMVFMCRHPKSPVVQAASIKFACLILFGSLVGSFGGLPMVFTPTGENGVCGIRLWLTALGGAWVIAPLLGRTWRLSRIFNNKRTTVPKFTSNMALVYIWVIPMTVFTGICLVLSTTVPDWTAHATLKLLEEREVLYGLTQPVFMNVCQANSEASNQIISTILLVVASVALLKTNQDATTLKGSAKAFDESSEISHASLLVLLTTIFLVLVNITTEDDRVTQIIVSLGTQLIFATISVAIFLPKLITIVQGQDQKAKTAGGGDDEIKNDTGTLVMLMTELQYLRPEVPEAKMIEINNRLNKQFKSRRQSSRGTVRSSANSGTGVSSLPSASASASSAVDSKKEGKKDGKKDSKKETKAAIVDKTAGPSSSKPIGAQPIDIENPAQSQTPTITDDYSQSKSKSSSNSGPASPEL
jgi:hypothetical protein